MMHGIVGSIERPVPPSRYEPRRFDPRVMLLVILIQGALVTALATHRYSGARTAAPPPLVVHSLDQTPPPQPEPEVERLPEPERPTPRIHAPKPLIELPVTTQPAIATTPEPVPVTAAPAPVSTPSPAPAAPQPARPVSAGDLSASMLHAPPPRYPRESRRLREQGTVVLELLLATDGTVQDIRVLRSSGHRRLDDAARDAVRRWRWSPTTHNGVAVQVRGTVEIPFMLTG